MNKGKQKITSPHTMMTANHIV